jgi:hypothetical protein
MHCTGFVTDAVGEGESCSSLPCAFLLSLLFAFLLFASTAVEAHIHAHSSFPRFFPVGRTVLTPLSQIMRRIMRKIIAGEGDQLGDLSTAAEPGVLDLIKQKVAESA